MLETLDNHNKASIDDLNFLTQINRNDKRYILKKEVALKILNEIDSSYDLLFVDGDFVVGYETNYYDTSDFKIYKNQLYGTGNKYSIRKKSYSTSTQAFIDIKESSRLNRVDKYIAEYSTINSFNSMVEKFTHYNSKDIEDKVAVHFNRFTFVNKKNKEKVSIDLDLGFSTNDEVKNLSSYSIIEVKGNKTFFSTPFVKLLKKYKVKQLNISKYCLAVYTMYPYMATQSMEKLVGEMQLVTA